MWAYVDLMYLRWRWMLLNESKLMSFTRPPGVNANLIGTTRHILLVNLWKIWFDDRNVIMKMRLIINNVCNIINSHSWLTHVTFYARPSSFNSFVRGFLFGITNPGVLSRKYVKHYNNPEEVILHVSPSNSGMFWSTLLKC